jgi:hypothetical protein
MTRTTKPVTRETTARVREVGQMRPVVITIEPSGIVTLRAKGTRQSYSLPVDALYDLAVKKAVEAERRQRKGGKR